jgi:RNA recognition motif-containing protein
MPRDSRSPPPHSPRSPRGRSPTRRSHSRDRDRSYEKKPLSESQGTVSIFIRNLSSSTREQDLRNAFEQFGNIRDVYIPRHYKSREPRGFAYIEFSTEKEAHDAIETMDGKTINGRQVTVTFALGKRKTPYEMRAKSGGRSYRRRSPSPYDYRRYDSYRRRRSYSRSYSRSPHRRSYSRSPSRRYSDRYSRRSRSRSTSPPRKEARRSYNRTPPPDSRRRRSWNSSPSRQKENNNGNHKEEENRADNRGE